MREEIPHTPSCNTKPASSPSVSSIPGIIRKSIHLPLKNKKLMLQVFILVLFPILILVSLHSLIATPLIVKVEDSYENSSLNHQLLRSLVVIEIPFAFAFCIILLFDSVIIIVATASTHQGALLGLLKTLQSIKSNWKKICVPGFYLSFLNIAFLGVMIFLTRLSALMGLLGALTYPYLASISKLVLVCSMEDQSKKAFEQAREITRRGKFQGYFLMLILTLLSTPIYVLFYVTLTDDGEIGLIARFCFLLVATILFCLTICFNNVVYTLFYLDCKQRSNGTLMELGTQYQLVPTLISTDI